MEVIDSLSDMRSPDASDISVLPPRFVLATILLGGGTFIIGSCLIAFLVSLSLVSGWPALLIGMLVVGVTMRRAVYPLLIACRSGLALLLRRQDPLEDPNERDKVLRRLSSR